MKRIAIAFAIIFYLTPMLLYGADKLIVNIPNLCGKTKEQVNNVIGKPKTCNKNKYRSECDYEIGDIEIVFINNKADWITVNDMKNAEYSKESLAMLGLPIKEPDFSTNNSIIWVNLHGLREVTFFPGTNSIYYVYIKAFTR